MSSHGFIHDECRNIQIWTCESSGSCGLNCDSVRIMPYLPLCSRQLHQQRSQRSRVMRSSSLIIMVSSKAFIIKFKMFVPQKADLDIESDLVEPTSKLVLLSWAGSSMKARLILPARARPLIWANFDKNKVNISRVSQIVVREIRYVKSTSAG